MHYCYVTARFSRSVLSRIAEGRKPLSKTAIKLWMYLHYVPGRENQHLHKKYIRINRRSLAHRLNVDPKTVDASLAALMASDLLLYQQDYTGIQIMLHIDPYMLQEGYITIESKMAEELLQYNNVAKLRATIYMLLRKDQDAYSIDRIPTDVNSSLKVRQVVKRCKAEHLTFADFTCMPVFTSNITAHTIYYALDQRFHLRDLTDIYAANTDAAIDTALDGIKNVSFPDDVRQNIKRLSAKYDLSIIKQAINRFATAMEDQILKLGRKAGELAKTASRASERLADSWKPEDREYVRSLALDAYFAAQARYEINNPAAYIRVVCEDLCLYYHTESLIA